MLHGKHIPWKDTIKVSVQANSAFLRLSILTECVQWCTHEGRAELDVFKAAICVGEGMGAVQGL